MTKLRHESFGNTACTSWRLLFVFALMPWLRKYRLRSGENGVDVNKFKFSKDSLRYLRSLRRESLLADEADRPFQ